MTKTIKIVNNNIVRLLDEKGKTMAGLRDAASQSITTNIKRHDKNYTVKTLEKISSYLDVEITELFKEGEKL